MEKVYKTNSCWLWTAALSPKGYGTFRVGPRQRRAHRVSYELFVGPIPDGAVVMHSCDVPRCVRPDHLTAGSQLENQQDMTAKGRGRTGDRNGWRLNSPKLTMALADEIRGVYALGGVRQRELAAEYGISQTMVSKIIRAERWAS
jgi:HNH endonuclease